DAIERGDAEDLQDELGDLLLQVVFHARMAEEGGLFGFDDVVWAITDKMIARHPHVFGDASRDKTPEQQTVDWERLKAAERGPARVLDGVALGLPALTRAVKLQKRAARVGFDWPSTDQVLDKLREEMAELVEARDSLTQVEVEEEFGDLMFVMANLARHMQVDPEAALRGANAKFVRRFQRIEDLLALEGRVPADSDLAEMDRLWNQAKAEDKARGLPVDK
ncbi:MAG: nucleoside triphosphate pyrophosphohydrolase, partial [Pseudorhodobacter sp.]|nr:nucleoside triphosphate pyrophosphohydrolase [Pseudorhodobacter sp.]